MAQQESIIKLKGKIGDLTFYKTKDGYQARQATGVNPERIATDPKYQRTRENNAEFATGGVASQLVIAAPMGLPAKVVTVAKYISLALGIWDSLETGQEASQAETPVHDAP